MLGKCARAHCTFMLTRAGTRQQDLRNAAAQAQLGGEITTVSNTVTEVNASLTATIVATNTSLWNEVNLILGKR